VNSAGARLDQADFAMSKIASNDRYGGNMLRKAIDYFCHCSKAPDHIGRIEKGDRAFAESEFFPAIKWLKDDTEDIYDPSYTDMLRVAFTSEFGRGKLQDLVALLSGRDFEKKVYEESIAEESFVRLKKGVLAFVNKTHFDRFTMIIRSAGFVTADLIHSRNSVNFAYILYLRCRAENVRPEETERLVRRWYALSQLTARYSRGSAESDIDYDIRQIEAHSIQKFCDSVIAAQLNANFWENLLPLELETASSNSAYFLAYQAAQEKAGDKGCLSRDITVRDLLKHRFDVHHVFPKKHLKSENRSRSEYNQIANFVLMQSEINIAIGDRAPSIYFGQLNEQVSGGTVRYGNITNREEMIANLRSHCIPDSLLNGEVPEYGEFLASRRLLMAQKIKRWYESL